MRKIFLLFFIVVEFMVLTQLEVYSQPILPPLIDIAQLNLKVVHTEVVDHISTTGSAVGFKVGANPTLSATKGYKLVLVTLKGKVPEPCYIPFRSNDFTAVYEEKSKFTKRLEYKIRESATVAKDLNWAIPPEGSSINMMFFIKETGPITINAAFVLPEGITSFYVRCPTLAHGKATISLK